MIRLVNLSKVYWVDGQRHVVLDRLNVTFPRGRSVALLGRNGAGKSTTLQIIAGTIAPTSGRVEIEGTISFPVGFAGSFHNDLTGAQNTRFVARIYGVDSDALCDFARDFAELGDHFHAPLRTYSSGMRSRLAFGISMGIRFDTYLIDEITAAGDEGFRHRSAAILRERLKGAGTVMVTHAMDQVRTLCDAVCVLNRGALHWYDDVDAGIAAHRALFATG
jgi:capsular polysaccharide transport system ATP-binding protein